MLLLVEYVLDDAAAVFVEVADTLSLLDGRGFFSSVFSKLVLPFDVGFLADGDWRESVDFVKSIEAALDVVEKVDG